MARYVLNIYENIYGGLHGINDALVFEGTEKEACEEAYNRGWELLTSYGFLEDELEEQVQYEITDDMTFQDIDELRHQIFAEDIEYEVIEIDESKAAQYTTHQLDSILCDFGFEEFCDKFCVKE